MLTMVRISESLFSVPLELISLSDRYEGRGRLAGPASDSSSGDAGSEAKLDVAESVCGSTGGRRRARVATTVLSLGISGAVMVGSMVDVAAG